MFTLNGINLFVLSFALFLQCLSLILFFSVLIEILSSIPLNYISDVRLQQVLIINIHFQHSSTRTKITDSSQ